MLRKINSLLTIPIFLLFIVHLILMAGLLTGILGFNPDFKLFGRMLMPFVLLHAAFGIFFLIQRIVCKKRGQNVYPKQNTIFRVQLLSGIAILILVFIHTTAYGYIGADGSFVLRAPSILYFILESLFALAICTHCAVSFPRMAVTFGLIKNKPGLIKTVKSSMIIFAAIFLIAEIAFCIYYIPPILGGVV